MKLTRSLARLSATAPARQATGRPRKRLIGGGPDCSPQRVGPAVAEHGRLGQVGRQAAHGRADSRRGARHRQTRAEQDDHLGGSTRPQVEQVDEVGGACDQGGVQAPTQHSAHRLQAARPSSAHQIRAAAVALTPDAGDLDHPAGHRAGAQRARWPRNPLAWADP